MPPSTRALSLVLLPVLAGLLAFSPAAGAKTIKGTAKNDLLVGTKKADRIDGKAGNDRISGKRGKDVLIGGKGKDKINGGPGDDTIKAKDGKVDTITCGSGKDKVTADAKDKLAADCELPQPPSLGNDAVPMVTLTVVSSGGGSIASSPAGISCGSVCAGSFNTGTVVTLTATADAHRLFTGWGGACSGTGACTVTLDTSKSVTATFGLDQHDLAVTSQGSGSGLVTAPGINCPSDCTETYEHGAMVSLSAFPSTGSTFAGWSGGCTGTGSCVVEMIDSANVTATFNVNTYLLAVGKVGGGTGTVTSSPSGVNCGLDCTESYAYGTMVVLNATNDPGSVFSGWSGPCSGVGACVVTMTAAATVTATFSPAA